MRLALQLGCTLAELGERMTAEEFGLWVALWKREPWGDTRGDLQAGIVASTIANWSGMTRVKSAPAAKPHDYMPFIERPEQDDEADPEAMFRNQAATPR